MAVLLVPAALAGCSSSPPPPAKNVSSGDAPSKSPSSPPAQGQAVAAYQAMWADMQVAATTADASSPRLTDHASGAALRLLQYMLTEDRQHDVVVKGAPGLSPEVVRAEPPSNPTRVDIRDCFDDTHWLLYKLDGSLKDNVPGSHYATSATVQLSDGRWKVTTLYLGDVGSC